ncbi:MAG TPA: hypothetical protein VMG37_22100 [Solirubrobacteraceae bacterium]|nr:hypothetical protein [Solirubrobacteraceae bacterium]
MDTARDLACADLWQASLERSLARRGKTARGSLELFHLRPERDLSCVDILHESSAFSQMRRSAVARRPAMSLPGAGGISALALLAATTLPGLLGGRGGGARTTRITYRADAHASGLPTDTADGTAASPSVPAPSMPLSGTSTAASASTVAAARTVAAAGQTASGVRAHAVSTHASTPAVHSSRPATVTHTPHIAAAHDAAVSAGGAPVSRSVSGGAAPAAQRSVSSASTVRHAGPAVSAARPAAPSHRVGAVHHASTGGGSIEDATSVGHPRTTATPTKPQAAAPSKPVTQSHPVAKPHPVAATPPASKPAPAPTVAPGSYVNPLAGANVTPERIDQGVDYSGSGTLGAIGAGKVTETNGSGWPGTFIEYQLTDGPDAGRYVYYAEGVSPVAGLHVGETLTPGQPVARIIPGSSTGIEIGWGSGVGSQPLAQALGQWSGGDDADSVPSPAGKNFSALIAQLGGPPGRVEG